MATYKVIQDIEAEDKLLGPLTLKQFVYAIVVAICGFVMFRLALGGLWFLAIPILPVAVFFGVLAAPFGGDQPGDVWLLAKVRFFFKPRLRIWNQSGVKELVTITVPKKVEHALTNNLSQSEVKSRLQALADTIDSRGWAVKNVNVNLFDHPSYATGPTDRLVNPDSFPQSPASSDVTAMDDMLDERSNPAAQQLDKMMAASAQAHRQQVVGQLKRPAPKTSQKTGGKPASPPPDYWFLSQNQSAQAPAGYATVDSRVVAPGQTTGRSNSGQQTPSEEELLQKLHENQEKDKDNQIQTYGHMRTIQPLGAKQSDPPQQDSATTGSTPQPTPVTAKPDPAILELANNDDLNVATIARQAEKARKKEPPKDEVVVSLH